MSHTYADPSSTPGTPTTPLTSHITAAFVILALDTPTTPAKIKAAHRQHSLSYHPDKTGSSDSAAKFGKCQEAYETLAQAGFPAGGSHWMREKTREEQRKWVKTLEVRMLHALHYVWWAVWTAGPAILIGCMILDHYTDEDLRVDFAGLLPWIVGMLLICGVLVTVSFTMCFFWVEGRKGVCARLGAVIREGERLWSEIDRALMDIAVKTCVFGLRIQEAVCARVRSLKHALPRWRWESMIDAVGDLQNGWAILGVSMLGMGVVSGVWFAMYQVVILVGEVLLVWFLHEALVARWS